MEVTAQNEKKKSLQNCPRIEPATFMARLQLLLPGTAA